MRSTLVRRSSLLGVLLSIGAGWLAAAPPTIGNPANLGQFSIGDIQLGLIGNAGNGTYAWSLVSGSLPPGLALRTDVPPFFAANAQAGLIGVATTPGSYSFTLSVTSGGQSASQAFTMNITALNTKDIGLPDAFVNTPYNYTFTTLNAANTPTYTSTQAMPAGLTLNSNGSITGTPTTAGNFPVNFTVSDGTNTVFNGFNVRIFVVNITTPGALPNGNQNAAYSQQLAAAGGSGSYTWAMTGGSLPQGLSLNTSTGVISGTINANAGPGINWFDITATDTSTTPNSYQKTMSIDVIPTIATQTRISLGRIDDAVVGDRFGWQIPTCCGGVAPFTWSASGLPAGMSIRSGSGVTSSYVGPNWGEIWGVPQAAGDYNVTVTATDVNGVSSSLTFPFHVSSIDVNPFNMPGATINVPYTNTFRLLGGTGTYAMSFVDGYLPANLSVTLNSVQVTGTPIENGTSFNNPVFKFQDGAGATLTKSFNFPVSGGTSTISINANGYYGYNLGTVTVGSQVNRQFSACCVASYIWSVAGGALPTGVNLSASGQLTGTATTAGTFTFLLKAADASNSANAGYRQFVMTVTPLAITTNGFANGNVGTVYTASLAATGGTGSLSWSLVFDGSFLPAGLTLNSNGSITGTPSASGNFNFTVKVTDSANNFALRGYNLDIYAAGSFAPIVITSNPNMGTFPIGNVQYALNATGGNPANGFGWALANGSALPAGITIAPLTSSFNGGNLQIGIMGNARTPGNYSFGVTTTNGNQTATQTFNLRITGLTLRDTYSLPEGFVGSQYSYQFTPLNNAGNVTFAVTNPALPGTLTLSSTGLLSGTAPAGSYQINFSINDGTDTVFRGFQLNIFDLKFTSNPVLPNQTQGAVVNQAITASGGTGPYTFTTSGGLPGGLSLAGNGTISGTVTSGPGKYDFYVTVSDTASHSYQKRMSMDIIGTTPALPRIGTYGPAGFDDATIGVGYSNGAYVCCGGTAPFTWQVTGLPAGMTFRTTNTSNYIGAGDVEIYGVASTAGTYNVVFTVTDANNVSTSNTFPLHVSELDLQPYLPNGTINTSYNTSIWPLGASFFLSGNIIAGHLPAGLTFDTAPGTRVIVSGTPTENGPFSITMALTDGTHTIQRTNYFNINGPNGGINIGNNGDLGVVTVGSNYSNQLNACCVASYTWTVTGGSLPPGITLSAGGLLNGIAQTAGTYTFLVKAADSANVAAAGYRQFTLVVSPMSITTNSLNFGNVGTAYNATLSAAGGTGALTWTLAPASFLPQGLTLSTGGVISGTPSSTGQYNFTVAVTDSASNKATRFFTINVYAPGTFPPLSITTGANFGTLHMGTMQLALAANGGTGTYAWTVAQGSALPPGLALRTDVPSFFNSSQQAGLLGVATAAGTYTFTLNLTSGAQTASQTFTLKITAVDLIDTNVPDAFVGVPYTYSFTPLSGALTFSVQSNLGDSLPAWASLSSSGVLTGTPTQAGNFGLHFHVSNGTDTVQENYSVTINALQITTNGALPNATQNATYNAAIHASGGAGGYTFSGPATPISGLSLNSDGTITGTVTAGPGLYGFNVTVTDSNHISYTKQMSINVIGVPVSLPEITGLPILNEVVVGNRYGYSLGVCCGGTAPFTWTASNLPAGLALRSGSGIASTYIAPGNVEIYGIVQTAGDYNAQLTVTDANGVSTTTNLPIHVSPLDVTVDQSGGFNLPNGTINTPYSTTIRVLGGTAQNYSFSQVAGELPGGLSITPNSLTVSGTPNENVNVFTDFRFTDSASNTLRRNMNIVIGGVSGSTISINNNGTYGYNLGTVTVGSSYSTTFFACCVPAYTWSFSSGTLPPGLTLSASGTLSGTVTTAGTYVFVVKAVDNSNSANAAYRQFTLTVTPMAITTSSLPFGNVQAAYGPVALTATGGTGNIAWTTAYGNTMPPGLTLSTDGSISGTPTSTGQYFINFTATDANSNIATRGFVLNIYAPGATPPLNITTGSSLGNQRLGRLTFQLAANGGTAPYHFSLTPAATVIPGMRVQDGLPLPQSFPTSVTAGLIGVVTAPGSYSTSVRVTDSLGATFDKPMTFTVLPLEILTSVGTLTHAVADNTTQYSYGMQAAGGAGAYTWSVTGLPAGITLTPSGTNNSTATISGKTASAGSFTVRITLGNASVTGTLTFAYTLVVDPFAITDSPMLPQATVNALYSHSFTAPGCGNNCTWTISGGIPGGFAITSGGTLTGTITSTTGANNSFTVQASGSNGTVSKLFTLIAPPTVLQPLSISSVINTTLTVGNTVAFALGATGGTPPYVFSLASGNLPTGISVQGPGETIASNFNPGSYDLAGLALQTGTYNFTVQVTDAVNNTATKAFTWTISPLSIEYTSLPIGTGNNICGGTTNNPCNAFVLNTAVNPSAPAVGQPMLVMGGSGTYSAWTTPNLASGVPIYAGLAMNGTTGSITGTPTNTGNVTQQVQVTDNAGNSTTQNVSINVASNATTTVSLGGPANGTIVPVGSNFTFNLSPSGGTGPYTIAAVGTLPAGVYIIAGNADTTNVAAGTYNVVISPQAAGSLTFTLKATDTNNVVGVRTYTITAANYSNVAQSTILTDASVGQAYSQPLLAFGPGTITWSLAPGSAYPPGLSVTSNSLSGTPTQAGTYLFVLNWTDGTNTSSATFTLKVAGLAITNVLTPPYVLPSATSNHAYSYQMTGTGTGTLTWSATGLPNNFSISPQGLITGNPTQNGSSQSLVTITLSNGTATTSHNFELYVSAPNPSQLDLPNGLTLLTDCSVGQICQYNFLPTGGTGPYTFTVANGSALPPGLQLLSGAALPATTGQPGMTILMGQATTIGNYTFTLNIADSASNSIQRTFTLRVTGLALVPGNPPNGITGVPYSFQFSATGGTPPYTFTVSRSNDVADALPAGVQINANGTAGLLSGTPSSTGNYSFNITVTDSAGSSLTRKNVAYLVTNSGGAWIAQNSVATIVGTNPNFGFSVNNGPATTYAWSAASGTMPPGLGVNSLGVVTGTSTASGTYTFLLRATGANSTTVDKQLTFTISPMQVVSPPFDGLFAALLPPGKVGTPYSFTFQAAGGVPMAPSTTPAYTYSESPFFPLPAGVSLSSAGVLSGTPTQAGNFTIRPIVTDASGNILFVAYTMVVTNSGTAPLEPADLNAQVQLYAGVPAAVRLDRFLAGGKPPYTWSVSSGALPAGMAIIPPANGVGNYLVGIPTTAGSSNQTFTVTDSSAPAQTLTLPGGLTVLPVAVGPDTLPPGTVGISYPATTIVPAGGVAPYHVQLGANSSLPPGLTLNNGVLSGQPRYPGVFVVTVNVTDSSPTPNTSSRTYELVIDDVFGEAPAITVSKPISVFFQQGNTFLPTAISVSSTSGTLPYTALVTGGGTPSLSIASGNTGGSTNLSFATLTPGVYTGLIAVNSPQAANGADAVPYTFTVIAPPPCSYSLDSSSASYTASGGNGSFTLNTGSACTWTSSLSDSWIHSTVASSGSGTLTVNYTVDPNANTQQQSGTITIGGQVFTITEFGAASCSFAISPNQFSVTSAGGQQQIAINASDSSCQWTASGLGVSAPGGQGSAQVSVTIPQNSNAGTQTLTATIANQTLTVTQGGADCIFSLSGTGLLIGASGLTPANPGAVGVTAPNGCAYNTSGPSWIHVVSAGGGTVTFTADPNSTTADRTGILTISGQPYQISEAGIACSLTVDASALTNPFAVGGGAATLPINANGSNCAWTATVAAGTAWATAVPTAGNGTGSVRLTVTSNAASTSPRSSSITIAGQTVNFSQSGTTCTFNLRSTSGSVPYGGGVGTVSVVAPSACTWNATSNAAWLTVNSSAGGGSGDVQFIAQPNAGPSSRTGTLTIAGQTYTVTEAGVPCTFTISGASAASIASPAVSGQVINFTANQSGCTATAQSFAGWLSIDTAPSVNGTAGTVNFSAQQNSTGLTRTGAIQVGNATYTVTQTGSGCFYSLGSYGATYGQAGGTSDVLFSASAVNCTLTPGTSPPGVVQLNGLSGPADGLDENYTVLPFISPTNAIRQAFITLGGQIFTVKQTSW